MPRTDILLEDDMHFHKSLIKRRTFLKAGAYASYLGIGLTLSYITHEEEEAQAIMPLLVIPVFISAVFVVNKDFREATIQTTLAFFNNFGNAVSGGVALIYGDSSSAVDPHSDNPLLASKQLNKQLENGVKKQHDDHLFEPLLLANRPEGKSFHEFQGIPPGKTTIRCRPFKVPIGSGQKWMYANTSAGASKTYNFNCH